MVHISKKNARNWEKATFPESVGHIEEKYDIQISKIGMAHA